MVMRLTGIVHGRQIELDRDTGLRDGATVEVRIEHPPRSLAELRSKADALCGAWAGDDSIAAVFDEIAKARAEAKPREVRFDAAS